MANSSQNVFSLIWKGIRNFFFFWKDFLVGDSPELAVGVLIMLGVAYLLRNSGVIDGIVVIVMVLALVFATVWRKTRQRS
ncbi:MAG TPA: hypothetical protein VF318_07905 [Dehalococcoidales bacterium]|jgi:hypothetical protein